VIWRHHESGQEVDDVFSGCYALLMLWDNEHDSENRQRFKNLIFLKMWMKNESRDAAIPWLVVVVLVMLVVMGLVRVLG
jgi:hypothetical protein